MRICIISYISISYGLFHCLCQHLFQRLFLHVQTFTCVLNPEYMLTSLLVRYRGCIVNNLSCHSSCVLTNANIPFAFPQFQVCEKRRAWQVTRQRRHLLMTRSREMWEWVRRLGGSCCHGRLCWRRTFALLSLLSVYYWFSVAALLLTSQLHQTTTKEYIYMLFSSHVKRADAKQPLEDVHKKKRKKNTHSTITQSQDQVLCNKVGGGLNSRKQYIYAHT